MKVGDLVRAVNRVPRPHNGVGVITSEVATDIVDEYMDAVDAELPSWWVLWDDGDVSWYHQAQLVSINEEQ